MAELSVLGCGFTNCFLLSALKEVSEVNKDVLWMEAVTVSDSFYDIAIQLIFKYWVWCKLYIKPLLIHHSLTI